MDYEFTSQDYAISFVINNFGADWIKLNGKDFRCFESQTSDDSSDEAD